MLQSSAYLTKRCLRRSSSRSSSSSTMFDRSGESGPPCGVPSSAGLTSPFSITSHFQERPDQLEHSLVGHPPCDRRHQFVVIDPIKELLKIEVHHPAISRGDELLRLGYRLMRRAFR